MTTIIEHEAQQVEHANATGRQPVVFVHGLWLLPSSWDRWAKVFEEAGCTTLTRARAYDRQRLAAGRRHVAGIRSALRLTCEIGGRTSLIGGVALRGW